MAKNKMPALTMVSGSCTQNDAKAKLRTVAALSPSVSADTGRSPDEALQVIFDQEQQDSSIVHAVNNVKAVFIVCEPISGCQQPFHALLGCCLFLRHAAAWMCKLAENRLAACSNMILQQTMHQALESVSL